MLKETSLTQSRGGKPWDHFSPIRGLALNRGLSCSHRADLRSEHRPGARQADWPQGFTPVSVSHQIGTKIRKSKSSEFTAGNHLARNNEGTRITRFPHDRNGGRKEASVLCSLLGRSSPPLVGKEAGHKEQGLSEVSTLGAPGQPEKRDSPKTDITSSRPFQTLCPSLLPHRLSTPPGNSVG